MRVVGDEESSVCATLIASARVWLQLQMKLEDCSLGSRWFVRL